MTSAYLRLLGLHLLAVVSAGQNILCCDNAVYSFTIDLARTCEDSNVSGPYIDDTLTTCILTTLPPFLDEGFFLEKITKVDVYEMSPTQSVIAKETLTTPLMDGTVFAYVSIVGLSGGVKVPNSLQVVATAETSTGASVINLWSVTYTDECILPAFSSGGEIGWMQVVSVPLQQPSVL